MALIIHLQRYKIFEKEQKAVLENPLKLCKPMLAIPLKDETLMLDCF